MHTDLKKMTVKKLTLVYRVYIAKCDFLNGCFPNKENSVVVITLEIHFCITNSEFCSKVKITFWLYFATGIHASVF